ncbi:hypothetical protein [Nonomuraea sp. NPDC049129]|uniref:hypothetical protein n=1 Tax=Nonomuraea sp. NPDC049129 TaxID=3155272 RepID=UPI0034061A60
MKGIAMIGPALVVGDTLLMPDGRELLISKLNPATGGEAIAAGAREVFSGSWSMTVERGEKVCVFPRHGVLYRSVEQAEVSA